MPQRANDANHFLAKTLRKIELAGGSESRRWLFSTQHAIPFTRDV
jgi:hypothetical protein